MNAASPMNLTMVAIATKRSPAITAAIRRQIMEQAGAFIRQRYRMDEHAASRLLDVPVVWRRGRGRSAFYPRACKGHDGPHIVLRIPPGAVARWNTYLRVRARWTTPPGGIELPIDVLMTTVLIHEFTHAVQHGVCGHDKRKFSEVETTENEIEFMRVHAPSAYAQLVSVPRLPRTRLTQAERERQLRRALPGRFGPVPATTRPTGFRAVALRLLREIWVRYQVLGCDAGAGRAAATPAR